MLTLPAVFLVIAFIYASVGFGGGSSYTALLIASGMDYVLVPVIALACNLIVVTGGVYHYWRSGVIDWKFSLPLIAGSVPAAFLGVVVTARRRRPVGHGPAVARRARCAAGRPRWREAGARYPAWRTGRRHRHRWRHIPGPDTAPWQNGERPNGCGNRVAVHPGQFAGRTGRPADQARRSGMARSEPRSMGIAGRRPRWRATGQPPGRSPVAGVSHSAPDRSGNTRCGRSLVVIALAP